MILVPFPLRLSHRKTRTSLLLIALAAGLLALLFDAAIIKKTGPETAFVGDADYFVSLAKSLAANHGYYLAKSSWPHEPNTSRAPLWPAMLSVTFRLLPDAPEEPAARYSDALLHAVTAGLMVLLAYQLTGQRWLAAACAAILAIYPPETAIVVAGLSEIAYLTSLMLGVILFLEGGKAAVAGAVFCGLSVLARSNFLLFPVGAAAFLAIFHWRTLLNAGNLRRMALLCAAFYCIPLLWMLRNYSVTGAFPLVSTMEGETLYGANNALVANDLSQWGYWTLPDFIPGEETKHKLAEHRSELELNGYYHAKASAYVRSNLAAMPRLELGKLIRGFVPLPWVPLAASYVVFGARLVLYVTFVIAVFKWRGKYQTYTVLLGGMMLVTLATTLIYYGLYRFTFCVEPFLLPVVAAAYAEHRKASLVLMAKR